MSILAKKTEKLASAIYLVTSFFDDKEPLKWKLRTLSTELVSERVKDKSHPAREIQTLFSVAKMASLVSEANYDILARELSQLENEVKGSLDLSFLPERTETAKLETSAQSLLEQSGVKDKIEKEGSLNKPVLKEFGAVSVKKNNRQSIIIAILKRKKEIMIKDISPVISGCSEKTIQRELSAMVQAGLVKKMGEKRWSRYSLA